jgi:hypothetical protein
LIKLIEIVVTRSNRSNQHIALDLGLLFGSQGNVIRAAVAGTCCYFQSLFDILPILHHDL